MNIQSLEQLFMFGVAQMLDAENMIAFGLQQMSLTVGNRQLKAALARHEKQTQEQIENLTRIFEAYEMEPHRIECAAAEALTRDYKHAMGAIGNEEMIDVVTALAADKVEHFEIACYRGLLNLAEELGRVDFITLLKENLGQEQQMAKTLEEFARKFAPALAT